MIHRLALAASIGFLIVAEALLGQPSTGPGGQSTLRQADLRVGAVAYRIALAGRPFCSQPHPLTGLLFHHLGEYEPADRIVMTQRHGLDRGPGILTVLADTPAARAGLVAGDVLLAVNGRPFPSATAIAAMAHRDSRRKAMEANEFQLEDQLRAGPARLRILRGGREIEADLGSVQGCLGRVRLARSSQTNAFANGRYVVMTTSMLEYLRNDDELAVVLAHELSHNILRHQSVLDEQGVPKKGLFRAIGGNAKKVWRTEEEADRFGIRLMATAGYDVQAAIPFWRRYLGKYDWFPQIFRTHPSLSARERITREAIAALSGPPPRPLP